MCSSTKTFTNSSLAAKPPQPESPPGDSSPAANACGDGDSTDGANPATPCADEATAFGSGSEVAEGILSVTSSPGSRDSVDWVVVGSGWCPGSMAGPAHAPENITTHTASNAADLRANTGAPARAHTARRGGGAV